MSSGQGFLTLPTPLVLTPPTNRSNRLIHIVAATMIAFKHLRLMSM